MHQTIEIDVLLHRNTGTAHAWPNELRDREYVVLRWTDENDLVEGAYELAEPNGFDSGPRHESFRLPEDARRHSFRRYKRNRAARRSKPRAN